MPKPIIVKIKKLDRRANLPSKGSDGSSGWDLRALDGGYIHHGQRQVVATGLSVAIPHGWEGQVRPRSGLAAKYGLTVVNAPGTIDSDYRGEVKIAVICHGSDYSWNPGDRLAQLVIQRVPDVEMVEVEELEATERGGGGFGSTGR